jgi:hypothetical protein
MIRTYLGLIRTAIAGTLGLPPIVVGCSRLVADAGLDARFAASIAVLTVACLATAALLLLAIRRLEPAIAETARDQAAWIDRLTVARLPLAVAAAAGLGLLFELGVIRWQASVFEFFAFYKNLGLLACFLGLGLGYSLARREGVPLVLVAPLLAWQFVLLLGLRYGLASHHLKSLQAMPFQESLNMGIAVARSPFHFVAIGVFLAVVFVLTALTFIPLGQLAGRFMNRAESLSAYGWNLLGSLAGVGAMLAASSLWLPPAIWFLPAFLGLVAFLAFARRPLAVGASTSLLAIGVLAWPVSYEWERIYSPYQLIERGPGESGLSMIRAAGLYHQSVYDFSPAAQVAKPAWKPLAAYYELPYELGSRPRSAAIVGAGTGNDVAGAIRAGVERVTAIEIDPAIVEIGRAYHPELPYSDPRVTVVVNDARSFIRSTRDRFDRIVYGLLDSHTLLSHASSVRIDSFVYTVEGIREARERLTDDGILSLAFYVLSPEIGRKIHLMMTEAFGGHSPVAIGSPSGKGVLFLQRRDGGLRVPGELLAGIGFSDRSAVFADPALAADPSTDDWPFFYMPRRVYPFSYFVVLSLVLALSLVVVRWFHSVRASSHEAVFFFLGAGFMLVETKAITELGLAFGNTWSVIGIAISGVLAMGFLANVAVQRLALRSLAGPFVLLLAGLVIGVAVARAGGLPPTALGRLATVALLTVPLLFSGIAFSICLRDTADTSGAMAQNVLGAMLGGLLEYNSMYFGFAFLYWLALGVYALAFTSRVWRWRTSEVSIEAA